MQKGKISILMGIYNCEETLEEAVLSIVNQTYSNWELILCDDGSSDHTLQLATSLSKKDKRIRVISNKVNKGLNITLNNCLRLASGEFVARMDGDDVCDHRRFEKQIAYLSSQSEYDICSSAMYFFDENGVWGRNHVIEYPRAEDVVCKSAICHAPVMMRKKCMDQVNGYTEDKHMLRVEDVNLWIKLYTAGFKCHNIDEALYGMRNDQNAFSRRKYKYRINSTYVRLKGCRALRLGVKCYFKAFTPMIVGLIPARLRHTIKRKQNRSGDKI